VACYNGVTPRPESPRPATATIVRYMSRTPHDNVTILLIGGTRSRPYLDALARNWTAVPATSGRQVVVLAEQADNCVIVFDAEHYRTSGERMLCTLRATLADVTIVLLAGTPRPEVDVHIASPTPRKLVNAVKRTLAYRADDAQVCGPFTLRENSRILHAHGNEIVLTPKQYTLAKAFFGHPNEVLSREWLMKHVWDTEYVGDTRTLSVHIRWLREAIEPQDAKHPVYLVTVRGVGYKLVLGEK
jgi:DNA-binding response OmpR family regulator